MIFEFQNSGYYQPGGPVFLCIDGEDNPWAPSVGLPHLRLANVAVAVVKRVSPWVSETHL